jgi:hypothetical protein
LRRAETREERERVRLKLRADDVYLWRGTH